MADCEIAKQALKVVVAQICQNIGWHAVQSSPMDILVDVLQRYVLEIAKSVHGYSTQYNRTEPNLDDLGLTFKDFGINLLEIEEYINNVEPVPPPYKIAAFPVKHPSNLQIPKPDSRELLSRPEHIPSYLPLMHPDLEEEVFSSQHNSVDGVKKNSVEAGVSGDSPSPLSSPKHGSRPGETNKRSRLFDDSDVDKKKSKPDKKKTKEKEEKVKEDSTVPKMTLKLTSSSGSAKISPSPSHDSEDEIIRTPSPGVPIPSPPPLREPSPSPTPPVRLPSPPPAPSPPPPPVVKEEPVMPAPPPPVTKTQHSRGRGRGKKAAAAVPAPRTVITETVGTIVDESGNKIWICPACSRADDGSPMIGCDECDDWYHWVCVGIVVPPKEEENWFCVRCIAKRQGPTIKRRRKKHKKDK
ncbi:Transcription initiation factor TFIID subunit like protein [Argiope bruennichi]|uniref:Transcription initiation factor TFIID subunit like protein n=1 Tax=Argiope bruennichi TaxID=94029 RepID=A0A8T0FLY5_ARGBR|nr:Transcription initiation factor TFIID subunit like protein [Argiope bruennichi]